MSETRRRTATATRRREREAQILAATRALFDERGVRDAQIEDIARAVGTNRAIIYRHFSGKEELFALTLVGYLEELSAVLREATEAHAEPTEQLRALVLAFTDYGASHPAFVDCALDLMRRPGPELLEEVSESAMFRLGKAITGCLRVIADVLAEGNASGDFAVEDIDLLANYLYASGLGALQLARVGMVVKEAAPGIPAITRATAEQVGGFMVASVEALTRAPQTD